MFSLLAKRAAPCGVTCNINADKCVDGVFFVANLAFAQEVLVVLARAIMFFRKFEMLMAYFPAITNSV